MQLVGADRSFIRKPFILQNIISGVVSSLLAMAYLYGILFYIDNQIYGLVNVLDITKIGIIFGIVLIFGVLIMISATIVAVNRYLKMQTGDMYYI